ncbi:MAG TPA: hypothetical protein VEJ18_20645 [Planctomycetota bacterium]|nr:hypothetical protein [Planctomycetota bacterium]
METAPTAEASLPPPERARDDKGRFVAEGLARGEALLKKRLGEADLATPGHPGLSLEAKEKIKNTDAEESASAEPPKAKETDADLESAFQALRLTGLKSKHLEKFSREEVLEIAAHEKKRQAENDAKVARANEVIKQREAASAPETQPKGPAFDVGKLVQPLGEEFGDEAASKFGTVLSALKGHYDEQLAELTSAIQTLAGGYFSVQEERARTRLAGRFPQVEDQAEFGKVKAKADKLFSSGTYESLDEAYSDAAAIVLGKAGPAKSDSNPRTRTNGQPSLASRSSPPVPVNKDDKVVAFLAARLAQRSPDEARRIAGLG